MGVGGGFAWECGTGDWRGKLKKETMATMVTIGSGGMGPKISQDGECLMGWRRVAQRENGEGCT